MGPLLLINPNTSVGMTALLHAHAQAAAGPAIEVRSVTAGFGAPYIACEASYAVAAHAVLDAWTTAIAGAPPEGVEPCAVLIGCFGDPGLWALRQESGAPVTGLAEGAFFEAAGHGRFAIVTGGERWRAMLERLAQALGFGDRLAGIETVGPSGAELAADPVAARALLGAACRQAVSRTGAQSVILGGAGLAGMAAELQATVEVPLIDSVRAGTRHALALAAAAARPPAGSDPQR